jgi:hypothetical protein
VNKEVVVHYFNGLHPAKQMFVMNYDMRKNHKDGEKNIITDTITPINTSDSTDVAP